MPPNLPSALHIAKTVLALANVKGHPKEGSYPMWYSVTAVEPCSNLDIPSPFGGLRSRKRDTAPERRPMIFIGSLRA
eukprot:scaffold165484_cov31-Tisochrysis_lutea.AAC.5